MSHVSVNINGIFRTGEIIFLHATRIVSAVT